jgi:signal transduction histidine kinase
MGIPYGDQDHLFELFHRAANVGSIQGSGLGLAIVKRAVETHGGTIDFISAEGIGTTFTVTIPLDPPEKMDT